MALTAVVVGSADLDSGCSASDLDDTTASDFDCTTGVAGAAVAVDGFAVAADFAAGGADSAPVTVGGFAAGVLKS